MDLPGKKPRTRSIGTGRRIIAPEHKAQVWVDYGMVGVRRSALLNRICESTVYSIVKEVEANDELKALATDLRKRIEARRFDRMASVLDQAVATLEALLASGRANVQTALAVVRELSKVSGIHRGDKLDREARAKDGLRLPAIILPESLLSPRPDNVQAMLGAEAPFYDPTNPALADTLPPTAPVRELPPLAEVDDGEFEKDD